MGWSRLVSTSNPEMPPSFSFTAATIASVPSLRPVGARSLTIRRRQPTLKNLMPSIGWLPTLTEKRRTRWIEDSLSLSGRVLQIRIRPVNQGLLGARKLRRIRALSASHLGADVRPRAAQIDVSDWLRSKKSAHLSQFRAAPETQSRIAPQPAASSATFA